MRGAGCGAGRREQLNVGGPVFLGVAYAPGIAESGGLVNVDRGVPQPISSSSGANWLSTISRIMSGLTRRYSWTTTLRRPAIEG
jgi:hypothetical protein